MTACVLDSSVTLAWVLPGEASAACDAVLDAVAEGGAVVPGLWPLETGNILLMSERRRRITPAERHQSLATLAELPIQSDPQTAGKAWRETLDLAAQHGLTVYDACYLELAVRLGLPLATLDRDLRQACGRIGVTLLPA